MWALSCPHNHVKTTEAIFIKLGVLIYINKSEAEFDFGDIWLNILKVTTDSAHNELFHGPIISGIDSYKCLNMALC